MIVHRICSAGVMNLMILFLVLLHSPLPPPFIIFKSVDSELGLLLSEANGNISNYFSSVRIWLQSGIKGKGGEQQGKASLKGVGFVSDLEES